MSVLAPAYRPRRSTETVLYEVVREHLETFLAHAHETYEAPLPRYVEQELREFLRCGVFAHGFVRCHCDTCGHDLLVAFSCKGPGVCPSCAGRRMANVAAHLADRVLPAVPVRQWVLSLPFELRALSAFRADVLSALSRIFVEAVFARHRACARRAKLGQVVSGGVTHVQRFGSSFNLNVHFHVMVLDGVFTRDEQQRPVFHPVPPPTREELIRIVESVRRRAVVWLERRGFAARAIEDRSQETAGQTPLEACAAIAMQRGSIRALPDAPGDREETVTTPEPPRVEAGAVERDGFNLHASVRIAADDDLGRERLMRYGARPPIALDRLRRLPGGRISYRIKKLRDGRAKHRVMTPLEFLARLAAIVAPPRYPLLRYHGVLAPRSSWRRDVIPKVPKAVTCQSPPSTASSATTAPTGAQSQGRDARAVPPSETRRHASAPTPREPEAIRAAPTEQAAGRKPPGSAIADPGAVLLAPNILSVRHWSRLLGGRLYAATPRIDWASLLRRTFDVDVLHCAGCGGRLRVVGEVVEPSMVMLVLETLGLPTVAPRAARARDPTEVLGTCEVD